MPLSMVRKLEAAGRLGLGIAQRAQFRNRARSVDEPMMAITTLGGGANVPYLVWTEIPDVKPDAVAKPAYRIPSLRSIRRRPANGYQVVSTFSGAGGSCLGFRMHGFRIAYANEFVEAARSTYRANADRGTWLDDRDIRTVSGESIRELSGIGAGEIDVLEGSPPCASFSTAGRRQEHWGKAKAYSDTVQRADDLFDEYVRLVRELRPRTFVAENVSGLVKGVAKGYAIEIFAALRSAGYRVAGRLLDAQWLGVPQARVRLVIVGIREDLAGDPATVFPAPLPYRYSVRDALPEIDAVEQAAGFRGHAFDSSDRPAVSILANRPVRVLAGGKEQSLDEPAPTILTHGRRGTQSELIVVERMTKSYAPASDQEAPSIAGYSIGDEWNRLGPGEQSDRYRSLVRANPDTPVPTISAVGGGGGIAGVPGSVATVAHPFEPRKFSIDELRRLSGFPADFVLTGTYAQQWERIGRAVPPPMMAAVARGIRGVLDAQTDE